MRSFDAADAGFFLSLLPGPRDREGLPESLRFWKLGIEQTEPEETFPVGLVYGPSGCGKSSMVKAGLDPPPGRPRAAGLRRGDGGPDRGPAAGRAGAGAARTCPRPRAWPGRWPACAAAGSCPRAGRS